MRSRQITVGKTSFTAPADFLFVPLVARGSDTLYPRLIMHLVGLHIGGVYIFTDTDCLQNDHLFISHYHDPSNGYTYLEDGDDWLSDGQMSTSSVIRKPPAKQALKHEIKIPISVRKPML